MASRDGEGLAWVLRLVCRAASVGADRLAQAVPQDPHIKSIKAIGKIAEGLDGAMGRALDEYHAEQDQESTPDIESEKESRE